MFRVVRARERSGERSPRLVRCSAQPKLREVDDPFRRLPAHATQRSKERNSDREVERRMDVQNLPPRLAVEDTHLRAHVGRIYAHSLERGADSHYLLARPCFIALCATVNDAVNRARRRISIDHGNFHARKTRRPPDHIRSQNSKKLIHSPTLPNT